MSFDSAVRPFNASDPNARLMSASCLDFLVMELVPMAERLAKDLLANDKHADNEEAKEAAFFHLESLGYRVGQGLAER